MVRVINETDAEETSFEQLYLEAKKWLISNFTTTPYSRTMPSRAFIYHAYREAKQTDSVLNCFTFGRLICDTFESVQPLVLGDSSSRQVVFSGLVARKSADLISLPMTSNKAIPTIKTGTN